MNTKSLEAFFTKYIPEGEAGDLIASFSGPKRIRKKTLLVKPGQDSSFLAFIHKGTFRVYFLKDDKSETTVWFSFAGMMVTDMLAFYKGTASHFFVEAIETSEISTIGKNRLEELYDTHPDYLQFGRLYAQHALVNVMERMLSLQTKSATERYLDLLKDPVFLQQIPLKYLASYLGVTDTSLSRIRKGIR